MTHSGVPRKVSCSRLEPGDEEPIIQHRRDLQHDIRYAYTFARHRANENEVVYRCVQCRKEKQKTWVIGDESLTHPCRLGHECRPEKYVRERGNKAVYEMARENGHHDIVADGSHCLQPKSLEHYAQLYCVHGVCNQEVDVPHVFHNGKENTSGSQGRFGEAPRRIVLDFEKQLSMRLKGIPGFGCGKACLPPGTGVESQKEPFLAPEIPPRLRMG
ncbi:hypothetical protein COOONC_16506 [Cooperia oncophora]